MFNEAPPSAPSAPITAPANRPSTIDQPVQDRAVDLVRLQRQSAIDLAAVALLIVGELATKQIIDVDLEDFSDIENAVYFALWRLFRDFTRSRSRTGAIAQKVKSTCRRTLVGVQSFAALFGHLNAFDVGVLRMGTKQFQMSFA